MGTLPRRVISGGCLKVEKPGSPKRRERAVRRGSGREGGGAEVNVDFGGHCACPKRFGLARPKRGFHVEIKEGVKEDVRQKRHEQEALHGVGIMRQYMIGVPAVD